MFRRKIITLLLDLNKNNTFILQQMTFKFKVSDIILDLSNENFQPKLC